MFSLVEKLESFGPHNSLDPGGFGLPSWLRLAVVFTSKRACDGAVLLRFAWSKQVDFSKFFGDPRAASLK